MTETSCRSLSAAGRIFAGRAKFAERAPGARHQLQRYVSARGRWQLTAGGDTVKLWVSVRRVGAYSVPAMSASTTQRRPR